jgi:thiopurine S-methyltransferase
MDHNFWHLKWKNNEIGFHLADVNPLLLAHFNSLNLPSGSRLFLPLCGKTRDIVWLLGQGYSVVGAELSELAIQQLFGDLGVVPNIVHRDKFICYSATNITIFVGDFFDLTRELLGVVNAVYDRAALVALPQEMRSRYSSHLVQLSACAPQLLIAYEYDQQLVAGPPFSISIAEVHRHYDKYFRPQLLISVDVKGGLKGQFKAVEHVWLLAGNNY